MVDFYISEKWYYFIIAAAACYLVGCFNFAVIISQFKNRDIRDVGSGNPGTMNMMRTFGLKVGIINFFCDALKGGLPVLAVYFIFRNSVFAGTDVVVADVMRYFCGLFVVIGHIFPVTMKFKGGKGIASTLGLFWVSLSCECWWYVFIGLGVCLIVFAYIAVSEWGLHGLAARRFGVLHLAGGAVLFKVCARTQKRLGHLLLHAAARHQPVHMDSSPQKPV